MKIGVFGGSFNPPHLSHVAVGLFALSLTDLDQLVVVPCFRHAWGKELEDFAHRRAMCELAFSDLRRVEISSIEEELQGTSFTLRTLQRFRELWPDAELALLLGADAVQERASWYQFEAIEQMATIIPFGRAGVESDRSTLPAPPPISASQVRTRVRQGASISDLVPRRVADYIARHRLYH